MRTRAAIVGAARSALLECGSLEFTLREIALRTGISISNLQYYFPTRLSLLRAVFEPMIETCLRDLKQIVNEAVAPRIRLYRLLERAMQGAQDREAVALMRHCLSLATIDRDTARILDAWHGTLLRDVAALVLAVHPALAQERARGIATLVVAMADGVIVRSGAGTAGRGDVDALGKILIQTVDYLLSGQVDLP